MFNQDQIQVKSKHLHQNVPQCPIPIWTCWSGICAYDHSESDNWNTGVQRGIQHDWSQQVWSKYQQLSFWKTYLYHRDGFIDNEDLHDMLASLGKVQSNKQSMWKITIFLCQHLGSVIQLFQDPTDEYLEAMMSEAPGPINFTMFLTLFGERLQVCSSIFLLTWWGSTSTREQIPRRQSRMLLAALTRKMWDWFMRCIKCIAMSSMI